jgi:hypothetical protein
MGFLHAKICSLFAGSGSGMRVIFQSSYGKWETGL